MTWISDLREAWESQGVSSGYTRLFCPACPERHGSPDRRRSVSLNQDNGWWKCWRCGWRGRFDGYEFDSEDFSPATQGELEEPSDFVLLEGVTPDTLPAWKFLKRRRVCREVAQEAGLGFARMGEHQGRVIMPIPGPQGDWIGWVGRDTRAKPWIPYWTAKGMDRRSVFFNDAAVREDRSFPLILTEGPLDALRHWPHAAACLGKPAKGQIERLKKVKRPIVIALDGDAWREGLGLARALRMSATPKVWALKLPPKRDLDDLDVDEVRAAVAYTVKNETDTVL